MLLSRIHILPSSTLILPGARDVSEAVKVTVRTPPAEHYGRSLSLMLLELAMMTPYGDPARHTAIVKRCDSALDAVPARPHPRIQLMD